MESRLKSIQKYLSSNQESSPMRKNYMLASKIFLKNSFYRRYKEVQHLHEEWSKKGESELPNIDIRLPIDDVDGIDDW